MRLGWNRKENMVADRRVETKKMPAWTALQQVPGRDLEVSQRI